MAKEKGCKYCDQSRELFDVAIKIADLRVSDLYVFRDQSYPGRCIVAFRDHRRELFELAAEELQSFIQDVSQTAKAIKSAFGPEKLNYGIFGDKAPHLHVHVVPKYRDGKSWGEAFEILPSVPVYLSELGYRTAIDKILDCL
jgi:diadenosine tetraphosphate (Ap4A) HIT family hydrolase